MKYMKKKVWLFIFLIGIVLIPSVVKAETITVGLRKSFSSTATYADIPVEEGTKISELKTLMGNFDLNPDDYLILNARNQEADNNDAICDEGYTCYGMSGSLQSYLYLMPKDNTPKTYTVKSIPPVNENMFESIVEVNYELFDPLSPKFCDEKFEKCSFIDYQGFKYYTNVTISYEYDAEIKKIAQKAIDNGLMDKTDFVATDVELLNYINYGGSIADYVSEFKNQVGNVNFKVEIDQRGGAYEPFSTDAIGFYLFKYNDTIYGIKEFMSITGPHLIYVPTDTTDVKTAIENRLKDLFGEDNHLVVTKGDITVNELLTDFGKSTVADGDEDYYILTMNDETSYSYGMQFFFRYKKDSTKINNSVSFKSSDLLTDVAVSTDEKIPLDTVVIVNHITDGETYEDLIKKLNIPEGEVFDISLMSDSQKKSITKLDNGNFLVSIPIPDKYNGKTLIVYYVSEDNKVTEYKVTPKDGYATFETDHFSTYTLTVTEDKKESTNPKTGDNILLYVSLLSVGLIGLVIIRKRFN